MIGTIALVFYTFPYLGIIFLPMAFLYYIVSVYYRRSSVETKRLDSLLRSILYGSYSGKFLVRNDLLSDKFRITETLTGVSTIRAYREQAGRFLFFLFFDSYMIQTRCIREAEQGLDMENRAYLMTVSIQRWLAVRLDFFGNILVLGIALFAAGFRRTVSPSKIGVVLSYTLGSRFMQQFMISPLIFFFFSK